VVCRHLLGKFLFVGIAFFRGDLCSRKFEDVAVGNLGHEILCRWADAERRVDAGLFSHRLAMVSHCLAPVGEPAAARALRFRNYEDFFNPTGLASSDDNVIYELCQSGSAHANWLHRRRKLQQSRLRSDALRPRLRIHR